MRALILRNDADAAMASARVLIDKGFQILCVDTHDVAEALVRMEKIDLLVMDERVAGKLTHTIALSGERRTPCMAAILMTDRPGQETDELYDLIPSLYALAGAEIDPTMFGQLALASVIHTDDTHARNETINVAESCAPDVLVLSNTDAVVDEMADEADVDIPSYADVIFAMPALSELANLSDSADLDEEADLLPQFSSVIAKNAAAQAQPIARLLPA